ncbi:hypothetical protein BC936DRAFT_139292, partial [Jimgerdemannia flammicorona]
QQPCPHKRHDPPLSEKSCNFTSQPLRANTVIARVRVKTVDHKLSMRKHVFVIPNNLVLTCGYIESLDVFDTYSSTFKSDTITPQRPNEFSLLFSSRRVEILPPNFQSNARVGQDS